MNENETKSKTFFNSYTNDLLKYVIPLGFKILPFVYIGGGSLKSVLQDKDAIFSLNIHCASLLGRRG